VSNVVWLIVGWCVVAVIVALIFAWWARIQRESGEDDHVERFPKNWRP
jgi:hypothetical protein